MKTIAIIPARGGSKGIYKKNIRDLCGKPLIYYQLKNALDSDLIDRVVLASDSEEILNIGRNLFGDKIRLVPRPTEICYDDSKTEDTLLYVLNQCEHLYKEKYDLVVTLEPTNPLNTIEHIDNCITKMITYKYGAIGCGIEDYSFNISDYANISERPMKKDIVPDIIECGNCWVTKVDVLKRTKNRLGQIVPFNIHLIPKEDSYHIDTETDWIIVEALMKQRLMKEENRYYESRWLDKPVDKYGRKYWKNVTDPDGIERDKTKEREKCFSNNANMLKYINNLPAGKILDVGCGLGFMLSWIDNKHIKHGVEISEYAANYAKQFGHVMLGVLRAIEYHSNKFDVVILNHVVEHFQDPIAELKEIRRILKPGGKLILGMPDFKCETARLYGDGFRLLKDTGHISLFGTFDMYRLLIDLMFEIEDVRFPYYETEYFTRENLLKVRENYDISPPALGNVVTYYAYKK